MDGIDTKTKKTYKIMSAQFVLENQTYKQLATIFLNSGASLSGQPKIRVVDTVIQPTTTQSKLFALTANLFAKKVIYRSCKLFRISIVLGVREEFRKSKLVDYS